MTHMYGRVRGSECGCSSLCRMHERPKRYCHHRLTLTLITLDEVELFPRLRPYLGRQVVVCQQCGKVDSSKDSEF